MEKIFFFPFHHFHRTSTSANLSAHPIIRTKSHILDKMQRWKIVSRAQNHALRSLSMRSSRARIFSEVRMDSRAAFYPAANRGVPFLCLQSDAREKRRVIKERHGALSQETSPRAKKETNRMSYTVGGVRESRGGWRNWKHMGALPFPFFLGFSFFISRPPFLSFFPCSFYPLGVSNNWDFYVTSKAFGFLFTEEIHFIIPLFLFLFHFILLSFLEFIAMNHKSYLIIGRPKVILNYLKLFQ